MENNDTCKHLSANGPDSAGLRLFCTEGIPSTLRKIFDDNDDVGVLVENEWPVETNVGTVNICDIDEQHQFTDTKDHKVERIQNSGKIYLTTRPCVVDEWTILNEPAFSAAFNYGQGLLSRTDDERCSAAPDSHDPASQTKLAVLMAGTTRDILRLIDIIDTTHHVPVVHVCWGREDMLD